MIIMDYNTLVRYPFKYLVCGSLYLSLKLLHQKYKTIQVREVVKTLMKQRNLNQK